MTSLTAHRSRFTTMAAAIALAACLPMAGCYKSQYEEEKKKAEESGAKVAELEKRLSALTSEANDAKSRATSAEAAIANLRTNGVNLVTLVNGQMAGTDQIRLAPNGQFVRHGNRVRSQSVIRFEDGRIADQVITVNRDDGKPNFTGAVKNSRPDGEWIWHDRQGRPATKEIWANGKIEKVQAGTIARDGKVTWRDMPKADRDRWFRDTAPVFANLPELIRETTVAATVTAPAPAPTGTTKTGTKSGTKAHAKK
ncbi:MAG: hypothetical protein ACK5XO_13950 [Phycisphaerales bacterium]